MIKLFIIEMNKNVYNKINADPSFASFSMVPLDFGNFIPLVDTFLIRLEGGLMINKRRLIVGCLDRGIY